MTTVASSKVRQDVKATKTVRIGIGVALSALTTVMLILAFPPYNVWPLAFFCLVPMLVVQYRVMPLQPAFMAHVVGNDLWVLWLVTMLFGLNLETWFIQMIPVLAAVISFLTVKGARQFHEQTSYRWFVLEGVFAWVGFEMIRSFIPLVRMHGFIGHTLHTQPWLIQPVSIFSVYGLNLLVILVNYALAQAALALFDRKWRWDNVPAVSKRLANGWLAAAGITLVVWVGISLGLLASAPKDMPMIRVAAVQHGFTAPGHIDRDTPQEARLQALAEQTRKAAGQGAQLVIWPELGVGFDPQVEYTDELRALAAETNAYLVIGYGRATEEESRNAAITLTPSGEFLAVSGKSHPSPGEPRDPDAGAYPVYDTPLGQLATIICHDANFTDSSRVLARKGAQLIAVPTFEVYIPGFEKMFYVQTLFRAVENRVTTVKADSAFSSTIVDPYGRILAKRNGAPDGEAFALVADVPLGSANTLYSKVGDWMGWLSLAGFIFFIVFQSVTKRRAKKAPRVNRQHRLPKSARLWKSEKSR